MRKGLLLIISGPSGVGKGTVIECLREKLSKELGRDSYLSVSMTTRRPRPGEIHGVHYLFVSRETFDATVAAGGFAEYAEFSGNYYGTPMAPIQQHRDAGDIVFFDIDVKGAQRMRSIFPDAVSVFINPPSMEELRRRIVERGANTPPEIESRLGIAAAEIARAGEFGYQVVNRDIEKTADEILNIINKELLLKSI